MFWTWTQDIFLIDNFQSTLRFKYDIANFINEMLQRLIDTVIIVAINEYLLIIEK